MLTRQSSFGKPKKVVICLYKFRPTMKNSFWKYDSSSSQRHVTLVLINWKIATEFEAKNVKEFSWNSDKTGSKFQGDFTSISASLWARRIFWEKMVTISLVPFWPRGRLMVLKVWKWLLLFFCFLWHDFALFHDLSTRWRLNHLTHLR